MVAAAPLDRVGKGLRGPPRDAIIADDATTANRGRSFGFRRAADTAGAVVGPLLGLAIYEALGRELRPLLWIAVVPAVLDAGLVFLVRERPPRPRRGRRPTPGFPPPCPRASGDSWGSSASSAS